MKIVLTELIISQAKTVGIMFCAGIAVETMWQLRKAMLCRFSEASERALRKKRETALCTRIKKYMTELLFWISAAATVSMFLYYCSYGKITLHAAVGFAAGSAFWKWLSKRNCIVGNGHRIG